MCLTPAPMHTHTNANTIEERKTAQTGVFQDEKLSTPTLQMIEIELESDEKQHDWYQHSTSRQITRNCISIFSYLSFYKL